MLVGPDEPDKGEPGTPPAKPEKKPRAKAGPKKQPSPKQKQKPKAKPAAPARPDGGGDARPLPNRVEPPDNPHRLAREFLSTFTPTGTPHRLRYWRGEFYRYDAGAYRRVSEDNIRAAVSEHARRAMLAAYAEEASAYQAGLRNRQPELRPVTLGLVSNVTQALAGTTFVPDHVEAPAWIDGATGPDPAGLLPFSNGVLDLSAAAAGRAGCLLPPDPRFFTATAAPFAFDPGAPPPREWLAFLGQLWPDDPESVACLQEWFGYLLVPDTAMQKILFVIGPRRSGKGTIGRVLRELVGVNNFCGPTLSSLATNFGLWPIIGKSVALVSDARLSGRADGAVIVERLLSVSGEDTLTIDRKNLAPVSQKLTARFVLMSNELPSLSDASGALAGRLILLRMTRSFYGQEDHQLLDRLRPELAGILLWAIKGWKRLRDRGRFVQPGRGRDLLDEMEDGSSPIGAFVRERCVTGEGCRVAVDELFACWQVWCEGRGRREPGSLETFAKLLRAARPELEKARPRTPEGRLHVYVGIRLRTSADPDDLDDVVTVRSQSGHGSGHGSSPRNPSVVTVVMANSQSTGGRSITHGTHTHAHTLPAMPGHGDHYDHRDQNGCGPAGCAGVDAETGLFDARGHDPLPD